MNKIIVFITLAILTVSCNKGNNINVTIDGVPNGRKVTLKKQVDKKIINIDSTTVENGKFSFNYKIKEANIFGIFIDSVGRKNEGIFPFLDVNDKVNIIAYKDSLSKSKVTGSKLHTDLYNLNTTKLEASKKMSPLTSEYQAAMQSNDTTKIKAIQIKARALQNEIQTEISANSWKYIKANPNSHVCIMELSGLFRDPLYKDSIKGAFNSLSDNVKNSEMAKQLKEFVEKKDIAPVLPQTKATPIVPTTKK